MKIIEKPLTVNQYSRPGRLLGAVKGIILHWVGAGGQRAVSAWNFFEFACPKDKHYSSAHYIIDLNGDIYHAVPDKEVAYHCGSSRPDPKSGKLYTDWARETFGVYAERPDINSPNNCAIGIELCVIDSNGNFTAETLNAARELTAKLLRENHLTAGELGTHYQVVGWKDCPRLWYNRPDRFEEFKAGIRI